MIKKVWTLASGILLTIFVVFFSFFFSAKEGKFKEYVNLYNLHLCFRFICHNSDTYRQQLEIQPAVDLSMKTHGPKPSWISKVLPV